MITDITSVFFPIAMISATSFSDPSFFQLNLMLHFQLLTPLTVEFPKILKTSL